MTTINPLLHCSAPSGPDVRIAGGALAFALDALLTHGPAAAPGPRSWRSSTTHTSDSCPHIRGPHRVDLRGSRSELRIEIRPAGWRKSVPWIRFDIPEGRNGPTAPTIEAVAKRLEETLFHVRDSERPTDMEAAEEARRAVARVISAAWHACGPTEQPGHGLYYRIASPWIPTTYAASCGRYPEGAGRWYGGSGCGRSRRGAIHPLLVRQMAKVPGPCGWLRVRRFQRSGERIEIAIVPTSEGRSETLDAIEVLRILGQWHGNNDLPPLIDPS